MPSSSPASTPDRPPLYPLFFTPIYKEKIWGGRTLERLGRKLPGGPESPVGESWELVDLSTTSASGGGGGSERSRVANGPLAGKTLHQVMDLYGHGLLGDLPPSENGEFPLLVKFLDARENLSVQVHPSAAYAETNSDAYLKSEAWYVLACEPGAVIYKGIREGVTPEQLRRAIEANTDEAVVPLLVTVPVEPGQCHYLPSGTCHALGAGVLVAEVQTPSDTTFRVYDWGRVGRELHVDEALECIEFGPLDATKYQPSVTVIGKHAEVTHLVRCEYFEIDRVRMAAGTETSVAADEPKVWMVLQGSGTIWGGEPEVKFERGQTLLLPPGMRHDRVTVDSPLTYLEVTFPQASQPRMA